MLKRSPAVVWLPASLDAAREQGDGPCVQSPSGSTAIPEGRAVESKVGPQGEKSNPPPLTGVQALVKKMLGPHPQQGPLSWFHSAV